MNETLRTLRERRSVRSFLADPVPENILDAILEAGTWAATGMNKQSPVMVVVRDKETIDYMEQLNAAAMGQTGTHPFYGAPVVLVVLAEKGRRTYVHDGALVMGNLMLAAHALGVGSCWIHRAAETFAMPHWQEFLVSLGLTGDYEGIGNCILGYTDGDEPQAPARRDGRVFYAD